MTDGRNDSGTGVGVTNPAKPADPTSSSSSADADRKAAEKIQKDAQEQEKRDLEARQFKAIQDAVKKRYEDKKGVVKYPVFVNVETGERTDEIPDPAKPKPTALNTMTKPSGLKEGLFVRSEDNDIEQARGYLGGRIRPTIFHKVRVTKQKDGSFIMSAVPRVDLWVESSLLPFGKVSNEKAYMKSMEALYEHTISCGAIPGPVFADPSNMTAYQIEEKIAEMRVHLKLAKQYNLPFNLEQNGKEILIRYEQSSQVDAVRLRKEMMIHNKEYSDGQEKLKQEVKAAAEKKKAEDEATKQAQEEGKRKAAANEAAREQAEKERADRVAAEAAAAGGGGRVPVAVAAEEDQLDETIVSKAKEVAERVVDDVSKLTTDLTSADLVKGKMEELEADCTALTLVVDRLDKAGKELEGWIDGSKVSTDPTGNEREGQIQRINDSMSDLIGVTQEGLEKLSARIKAMDNFVKSAEANLQGSLGQEGNKASLLAKSRLVDDLLPKLDNTSKEMKELMERAKREGIAHAPHHP